MLKAQVIQARKDGLSYSKIKELYGVAKSTSQDWVAKSLQTPIFQKEQAIGYVNENIQRVKPERFKKTENEVLEFLNNLAPINLPSPVYQNPKVTLTDYVLVCSDLHFPLHCKASISIFFETVKRLNPSTIIINGDSCDILALSRYPKDIQNNYNLLEERVAYHEFLHELVEISNGAKIYETSANHSSGGPESRWRRYLSERIPELGCLPEVLDVLTYENIFLGKYKEYVEVVDYVEIGGIHVMHGTVVRGKSASSVIGEMEKYKTSIMMGHVHRLGSAFIRQPAIGKRKEKQHGGWEIGCMCDLNPIYASSPNWANGFAIINVGENTTGVELVNIVDGEATIAAIGATIYA